MIDGRFLFLLLFGAGLLCSLPAYFRWEDRQRAKMIEHRRDLGLEPKDTDEDVIEY